MTEVLYHYYDESTGPFRNLSDLGADEAGRILNDIRRQRKGFASQRSPDYLSIRRSLEQLARDMFVVKGGIPVRLHPHYMTFGPTPWLLEWYPNGKELPIPITDFHPLSLSFTYGDLFPTMRVCDGRPYRKQVYKLDEIYEVVREYGLPQEWNPTGDKGPERYIEVQVWDEAPLQGYMRGDFR